MSDNISQLVQKALTRLDELTSQAQSMVDDLGEMAGREDCYSETDAYETRLADNFQSQFTILCAAFDRLQQPTISKQLQEGFARYGNKLTRWDYEDYTGSFLSPVQIFLSKFITALQLNAPDKFGGSQQAGLEILENILMGTATIMDEAQITPTCESDINRLMKPIIRAAFPDSIPSPPVPTVVKTYKPEMGVPSLGALVEYKYATSQNEMKQCVDGIFADSRGYTADGTWKKFYAVFFQTGAFYNQPQMDAQFKQCGIHDSWKAIVLVGKGSKKAIPTNPPTAVATTPVAPTTAPAAT